MTRTVHCRKYKQDKEGLAQPPYPGVTGQDVYENVSKQAWNDWMSHQTMLINEKQLNLMDKETRKYLSEQMSKYLSGDEYDKADGYVPPEK